MLYSLHTVRVVKRHRPIIRSSSAVGLLYTVACRFKRAHIQSYSVHAFVHNLCRVFVRLSDSFLRGGTLGYLQFKKMNFQLLTFLCREFVQIGLHIIFVIGPCMTCFQNESIYRPKPKTLILFDACMHSLGLYNYCKTSYAFCPLCICKKYCFDSISRPFSTELNEIGNA